MRHLFDRRKSCAVTPWPQAINEAAAVIAIAYLVLTVGRASVVKTGARTRPWSRMPAHGHGGMFPVCVPTRKWPGIRRLALPVAAARPRWSGAGGGYGLRGEAAMREKDVFPPGSRRHAGEAVLSVRVTGRRSGVHTMKMNLVGCLLALAVAVTTPAFAEKTAGDVVDDSTIASKVKTELLASKEAPGTQVNVEVYKGVVLLSGFVTAQAEKDAAGRIAKGVTGVQQVRNVVAVHAETSAGTKLDDTMLVGKVKAALVDAKDVKSGQINVEARGGIVQLGGFVTSNGMRDRALAAARGVKGVTRVDDALFVKPQ
jgi:hyperosmotically inducible protein